MKSSDTPYLNREIDEKLGDISQALTRIEVQTTKTNGRVLKLETEMVEQKTWRAYVIGFCACITIIILPIVYIIVSKYYG